MKIENEQVYGLENAILGMRLPMCKNLQEAQDKSDSEYNSGNGCDCEFYLGEEDLRNKDMRIRMIGDVTCDIKGSIKSTVRPATHDDPYYDYNPMTEQDEPAFSSPNNISVMAVDTCPNALAMDTSAYFGEMLTKHVFEPLMKGEHSEVIERSMILKDGVLTPRFNYLTDFAKGK